MKRKSEEALRRAQIRKTVTALVRLKHSLLADEEINEILPDTMAEFDEALTRGELKQIESVLDQIKAG